MSLKGVALVTGAGQGIGRAIALRLADDGFDLAVNDITPKNLEQLVLEIQSKQRKCSIHVADVSVEEQVKTMVNDVVGEHGGLDVMVANAGVVTWDSILETTEEEWDRVFSINAKGTFFCYKHAGAQMIAQGRKGRIIGASSYAGKQGSFVATAYCCSKFAVRGLTQAAALEFGPHGITVNAYAPGAVETSMFDYLHKMSVTHAPEIPGGLREGMKRQSAVRSNGTPEDIANLVSFLASKESSFITGQSISCNGGIYFD